MSSLKFTHRARCLKTNGLSLSHTHTHTRTNTCTHTVFSICCGVSDRFVMQQHLCGVPGIKVLHSSWADRFTDLSEESLGIPEGMKCKLIKPHTHINASSTIKSIILHVCLRKISSCVSERLPKTIHIVIQLDLTALRLEVQVDWYLENEIFPHTDIWSTIFL